jgi:hypothetical protein
VQEGEAQKYVDISSRSDAAMGRSGQIPQGRRNGFHLDQIFAWKGNQPSRRAKRPDLFAISAPRQCG